LEARITLQYDTAKTAKTIAKAVSPENFKTPHDLVIKTTAESEKVLTCINSRGKMLTFISTIDDLLFSASIAERTLQTIEKSE
jgi:hypothetical protein